MQASHPLSSVVVAPPPVSSDEECVPTRDAVRWTTHAAKEKPLRVLLTLAVVSITWWVALSAFPGPFVAVVCCLAILGSVAEGLFPVHHRITENGVSTRCAWQIRSLGWEAVKSARAGKDGLHLSPLPAASRLSRVRGVTLRYPDGDGPDVLAISRRYLNQTRAKKTPAS